MHQVSSSSSSCLWRSVFTWLGWGSRPTQRRESILATRASRMSKNPMACSEDVLQQYLLSYQPTTTTDIPPQTYYIEITNRAGYDDVIHGGSATETVCAVITSASPPPQCNQRWWWCMMMMMMNDDGGGGFISRSYPPHPGEDKEENNIANHETTVIGTSWWTQDNKGTELEDCCSDLWRYYCYFCLMAHHNRWPPDTLKGTWRWLLIFHHHHHHRRPNTINNPMMDGGKAFPMRQNGGREIVKAVGIDHEFFGNPFRRGLKYATNRKRDIPGIFPNQ